MRIFFSIFLLITAWLFTAQANISIHFFAPKEIQIEKLTAVLNELSAITPCVKTNNPDEAILILKKISSPDTLKEEYQKESFYKIETENKVTTISAETSRGLFYGLAHYRELILLGINSQDTLIEEYPKMFFRGIADDISRGQISKMKNFKEIIRFCGLNRMNFYFLYLEDVLELKSYPNFAKGTSPLTAGEIKKLEEYAKKYFVEIVPIFQALGHQENILLREEFLPYAEYPGAASFRIGNDKVMEFLEKSIKETAEMFSSQYFHIGADESWDVGYGEGRKNGDKKEIEELHLKHYKEVFKIVEKLDKKIIMYSDMLLHYPDIIPDLPKNVTVMLWLYHVPEYYKSAMIFAEQKQPYLVSHSVWNWNRPYPDNIMAKENIFRLTRDGYMNNAVGSLVSSWGDYGSPNFRDLNYYGYAWAARCSWNPPQADIDRFDEEFWTVFLENKEISNQARIIHEILTQAGILLTYQSFFRHPYFQADFENLNKQIIKAEKIRRLSNSALALLKEGQPHPYFEQFQFAAQLFKLYSKQLNILIDYHQTTKYPMPYKMNEIAEQLKETAKEMESLKKEYSRIWLGKYRKNKLYLIEKEFDYSIFFLNQIAEDIIAGNDPNGEIPGHFITFPKIDSISRKEIYVRKDFTVESPVKEAKIQIIAAGNAKLWINGKEIGEVYAQPCLSLLVKRARVQVFDVSKDLKKGLNQIAIQGKYFRKDTCAVHCFLTYQTENQKTHDIFTDTDWNVSVVENKNWRTEEARNENWKLAVPYKHREIITRPYLWNNIPSIIQDWR